VGVTRDLWKSIKKHYDIDKNKHYKGFNFGPTLDKWETADADYVHELNEINALFALADKIKDMPKYAGKLKTIQSKLKSKDAKLDAYGKKCNKLLTELITKADKIVKISKKEGPAGLEGDMQEVWKSLGRLSKSRYNTDFEIWTNPDEISYIHKKVDSSVKTILRSPV